MSDQQSETAVDVISLALFDIHSIPGDSSAYANFKHKVNLMLAAFLLRWQTPVSRSNWMARMADQNQTAECMWCRYLDHPAGPDCPLHGSNEAREPMIFVRADGFYPVASVVGWGLIEQASEHASLSPGTLRVEDQYGNVLWRSQ